MSYYTAKEKRERVMRYLTSDELGEYDYIVKDLNHWESEYEKLEKLIENANSQKNRYEYLSDVYKDIYEHDNKDYEYQSVEDE